MDAEEHDTRACEVSEADARAELDRLLSDPRFHATDRAKAILGYIAEQGLSGRAEGVKAYSIAIDVLGRTSSFDASLDPIVRIEVSRLRTALSQYYEAYGSPRGIMIDLPKGRYVTIFSASSLPEYEIGGEAAEAETARRELEEYIGPLRTSRSKRSPVAGWQAWAAIAAVLGMGTALMWGMSEIAPAITVRPAVSVEMVAADAAWSGEANATREMLLTALTQFRTLTVTEALPSDRLQFAAHRSSDANAYRIEMKYYGDGNDRSIWWQIANLATGEVLRSGVEREDTAGKSPAAVSMNLAASLARRFASSDSVINNAETYGSAAGSLGNACVLRAERALEDRDSAVIARSMDCLERTIAKSPDDADAGATLARALLTGEEGVIDQATLARSYKLANRSVSLAPRSDRAQVALMMTQFAAGWNTAAIDTGNRAMSLNPNNPDVGATLATVLFASGYFDAGVSLARDAGRNVDTVPGDAVIVLALDAYRRSDWSEASLLAEQVHRGDYVLKVLRIAALAQLGSSQAAPRLAAMQNQDPDFIRLFHQRMEQRHYHPSITAKLKDGLTKAGADFKAADRLASAS
ncbi:hypothetical protein ACXHXG_15995 [Rhizobium sp. LEGMi198b]